MRAPRGPDALDARALRALLAAALARSGDGMIVLDGERDLLFACPTAARLVERLGGHGPVAALLSELEEGADRACERRLRAATGPPVRARAAALPGAPPARWVVFLRDEAPADERLYAVLRERYGMSRRSVQLALLVRQGLRNGEIARELRLSEATVKVYLHHLYRACRVSSRTALVALVNDMERRA